MGRSRKPLIPPGIRGFESLSFRRLSIGYLYPQPAGSHIPGELIFPFNFMLKSRIKLILKILPVIAAIAGVFIYRGCSESDSSGFIKPTHPWIYYLGRHQVTQEKNILYDWPGFTIKAKFKGTSISMILIDSDNIYNVFIDGELHKVLYPNVMDSVYKLASNLADAVHTIEITKRTEAFFGMAEFRGFILDKGKSLVQNKFEKERKIAFVGDSYITGYGNEGLSPDCPFSRETENNYLSFAAILARNLDADANFTAVSGIGITKNYGDTTTQKKLTMPVVFSRSCYNIKKKWNFRRFEPDAVVVRLGRNDFARLPYPGLYVFRDAYIEFIKDLRIYYPNAAIFALGGPGFSNPHAEYIHSAVKNYSYKYDDYRVYYVKMNVFFDDPEEYGCQYHPNVQGHLKMAKFLEPFIREKMNW